MRAKITAFLLACLRIVGLRDLLCFGGLACVGYGLAQVSEPLAWVVIGGALFWLSVKKARGNEPS